MKHSAVPVVLVLGFFLTAFVGSVVAEEKVGTHADLVFAEVDGQKLQLDLFVPAEVKKPPLVVYIHGGSSVGVTMALPSISPVKVAGWWWIASVNTCANVEQRRDTERRRRFSSPQ